MALSTLVFWLIAVVIAGSSVVVVGARNILHAAFALCTAFLGVGALYVLLHADFVAAVQLIVYVGGILVLIMFAVMFSSNVVEDSAEKHRGLTGIAFGAVASLAVFSVFWMTIQRLEKPLAAQNVYAAVDYSPTIGVAPDAFSKKDETLLAKHAQLLNPAKEPGANLSNNETVKARMKSLPADEAKELNGAWERQRGRMGIGHKLIGEYLLPFEVVSILLLAALIGAVVIVRKELS